MTEWRVSALLAQGNFTRDYMYYAQAVEHYWWIINNLDPISVNLHYSKRG